MRILQLTNNYPSETDRTEGIFLHRINCELADRTDINVIVLRPKFGIPKITKKYTLDGVVVQEVNYFRPRGRIFNSFDGVFMLSARKSLQLRIEEFDVIHSHWQTDAGLLGTYLSKKYQKPHIVSVRGARIFEKSRISIYGLISSFVFNNSSLIHTNGSGIQVELKKKYLIPEQKLKWIPNIIFNKVQLTDLLKTSLSKSIIKDSFTFLFIGLDGRNKGLLDAVQSFLSSSTKNHQLIIVTNTTSHFYKTIIEPIVSKKANIIIKNKIRPEDVSELFSRADVFLFPSYAEGSPNVIIEAMAAGCYIISYKIPGVNELIFHNKNGRLVKKKDIKSLSREIDLFVSSKMNDSFERFKGFNHSFILENFNPDQIIHAYLNMFTDCIQ